MPILPSKPSLESERIGRQNFFKQYPRLAERWSMAEEKIAAIKHLDIEHFLIEYLEATYRHRTVDENDEDYLLLVLSHLDPLDARRNLFCQSEEGRPVTLQVWRAIQEVVGFEVALHDITT
jgi:hypothetical protein